MDVLDRVDVQQQDGTGSPIQPILKLNRYV